MLKGNWHEIIGGNGMCACGTEQGNCNERLQKTLEQALIKQRASIKEEILKLKTHKKDWHLYYDSDDIHKLLSEKVVNKEDEVVNKVVKCYCHCHYDCQGIARDLLGHEVAHCKCMQISCSHCLSEKGGK